MKRSRSDMSYLVGNLSSYLKLFAGLSGNKDVYEIRIEEIETDQANQPEETEVSPY